MGFHVRIDENSEAFLKKMRSNPAEVFDKPYKGYLLFLTGYTDQQACEWLRDNVVALDSLTGDDIAFALFAASFNFQLHLPDWATKDRKPKKLGALPITEMPKASWTIKKLVKSGRWGMAVDGDELTAMTYAVDDIAKRLQILDKLPCVVVLDAVPSTEIHVITLSDNICEKFLTILRKAISEFSKTDGYGQLETDVARLLSLHHEIELLNGKRPALQKSLKQIEEQIALAGPCDGVCEREEKQIVQALQNAIRALAGGSLKQFRCELTGHRKQGNYPALPVLAGIDHDSLERIFDAATSVHPSLFAINSALDSLDHFSRLPNSERKEYISKVLTGKLTNLVSRHKIELPESPLDNFDETIRALKQSKETIIGQFEQLFPSVVTLVGALQSAKEREAEQTRGELRKEANKLRGELKEFSVVERRLVQDAEEKLAQELRTFLQNKPPSLWEAISSQLRSMTLTGYATSIKSRLNEIATGVLSPDFLMKYMEASSK